MAAKKIGVLLKEARTSAGLTQEKLANAAGEGLTAADISKCERGEADLSANQLRKIAVVCGVTQKSLVEAPKNLKTAAKTASTGKTAKKETAKKTEARPAPEKKEQAKTAAAKTGTAKAASAGKASASGKASGAKTETAKTSSAAKKTTAKSTVPAGANTSMKVTATEKKLVEAYREAPSELKKAALKVLKGEYGETISTILGAGSGSGATAADGIGDLLGGLLGNILSGK